MNNALTKFTSYSARASKYAIFFLLLGTSFFWSPVAVATPQELMVRNVTILCANPAGETHTANTGWDADNSYFNGKGDIARLFCEGGFGGQWTTYLSDNYTGVGRFYNGINPTPAVTPTPTPSSSPSPSETPTATASPSPSPSETITVVASPQPSPLETKTVQIQETNTATIAPSPQPSESATPIVETVTVINLETSTVPSSSETQLPGPTPVVPATPPAVEPEPQPQPVPQPAPEIAPEPLPLEPEAVVEPPVLKPEPALEPPVVEEEPPVAIPDPEPIPEPAPEPPIVEDNPTPEPEVAQVSPEPPVAAPDATDAEKEIVAQAIIEQAHGKPVTAQAIEDAGLTYADLPPLTPVEVRQDENGNEVVVIASVAAALELFENPAELINAIFTDPAQTLLAIGSIGADMSIEERAQSQKTVVAAVIVGQIAGQAAVTAAAGAAAYRRKP